MTPAATAPAAGVTCARMSAATRAAAQTLLGEFLQGDAHYRASSAVYGDSGRGALERALDLFFDHPQLGFVWLAFAEQDGAHVPAGACVVCRAISTSRGAVVAKLDDVTITRPSFSWCFSSRRPATACFALYKSRLEKCQAARAKAAII